MYKVLLEHRAENDLDVLDSVIRERILERVLKLQNDPRVSAKKLQGSTNAWRLRVGDWRIIYEIDDTRKEIKIYRIKHRSGAY